MKKSKSGMFLPKAKKTDTPAHSWFSIKAQSNNSAVIKLYDEIGGWGVTARSFAQELASLGDIKNIELRIDSPGGDVFEGITIYNLLKGIDAYVTVYIDGLAASMGSVIAMAGDKIIIPTTAFIMIHKPWGGQVGDADDLRAYADLLDKVETTLSETYMKKTGLSAEEVATLLKEETWFSGTEAVEAGFADELSTQSQTTHYANSKRMENYTMPDKLKALLKPKASAAPIAPDETPNAPVTEADILAKVQAAETTRRASISNIFANFGGQHKDIESECLLDMSCSVDAAKDKILAHLGKDTSPATPGDQSHVHAGNGNIVGDSVASAILSRAGHQARDNDNMYNNYNLRELARASLADRGIACATQAPLAMIGMAFTHTSSDFGQILIDVAHKSLLKGWEDSAETFEMWTNKGSLSDFKTSNRVGLDELGSLRKVKEGAEYKYITTSDRAEQIALATYGEIFAITRQAIINDDLSALTRIPTMMGRAAKATIGDLVYAILTNNPTMNDGKALFHNDHGNIGTGAISDINALDKLRQLMRTQKSGKRNLNIRPEYILGPTALEAQANQTIRSASVKGTDANSGIVNPLQNFATYIGEPRLDDDSAVKFYMAAAQGQDTIEVAYLDGIDTPYIEQQEGFTVDGVSTKVRIDAGVAPLDYRGLVRSSGVA
ncbi:Clp protease ClpP [Psychromonas sp. 14N.309.X.WAT.B.A12]|uniref:ClpP-like prohead protease/major capsid protein fusion protein n=1 Tax=Psychromonas sp. 14N.309.X.WAT.B.A12 TaxID=2998322 RepID=UPI0025B16597|nr:ClpP-like prohead protease/major capsid protein fusion protein [Psychromonas sp. 14N.309.X.WAT.B.A12]MDN2661845.1 Clp protease ClpP [Psychromonas sp. 14N.309.X.WAT.B.A12]